MAAKDSALLIALGGKPPGAKGEASGPEEMSEGETDFETEAFRDIISAVKKGDADGGKAALKSFIRSCMSEYEAEGEEDEV